MSATKKLLLFILLSLGTLLAAEEHIEGSNRKSLFGVPQKRNYYSGNSGTLLRGSQATPIKILRYASASLRDVRNQIIIVRINGETTTTKYQINERVIQLYQRLAKEQIKPKLVAHDFYFRVSIDDTLQEEMKKAAFTVIQGEDCSRYSGKASAFFGSDKECNIKFAHCNSYSAKEEAEHSMVVFPLCFEKKPAMAVQVARAIYGDHIKYSNNQPSIFVGEVTEDNYQTINIEQLTDGTMELRKLRDKVVILGTQNYKNLDQHKLIYSSKPVNGVFILTESIATLLRYSEDRLHNKLKHQDALFTGFGKSISIPSGLEGLFSGEK